MNHHEHNHDTDTVGAQEAADEHTLILDTLNVTGRMRHKAYALASEACDALVEPPAVDLIEEAGKALDQARLILARRQECLHLLRRTTRAEYPAERYEAADLLAQHLAEWDGLPRPSGRTT